MLKQAILALALSFSVLFLPLTSLQATTLADTMNADYVIGSGSPTQDFTDGSSGLTNAKYSGPLAVYLDSADNRLFVADNSNNRVLVFNVDATTKLPLDYTADYVLGQPDFTTSTAGSGATGLTSPSGLAYDPTNKILFISDLTNNRVVGYNVTSITNGEAALYVYGQAIVSSGTSSNRAGSVAANTLSVPDGLVFDDTNNRLFVADRNNNRIVVWSTTSISTGDNGNAASVLGQANFTSASANRGGSAAANTLKNVGSLDWDSTNNYLYAGDGAPSGSNNRILIFDVAAITDGENAINVLGQPDFTTTGASLTAGGLGLVVGGVSLDESNDRLFVTDSFYHRVLVYDVATLSNGESAVNVLGQANFTSNSSATTQAGMYIPTGIYYEGSSDLLFVNENFNDRTLIFDLSATVVATSSGMNYTHPPLCTATLTPSTITKGEQATLSWNIKWPTDRQSIYYTKVPKNGLYSDRVSSITISPTHTTTYRIATFNLWGANFCESTITVLNEQGEELTSPKNSLLTAGAGNSPFAKAILNFFRSIFSR